MIITVFISYSHRDARAREKLETHLASIAREGVKFWYDGNILGGGELNPEIRRALRQSNVFVALASPDYLKSEYCFENEYQYALRRAARKTMYVVIAVIRPCQWKHTRMGRYKALPKDGKPASRWTNRDLAYEDIVDGIRQVVTAAKAAAAEDSVPKLNTRQGRRTNSLKVRALKPVEASKAAKVAAPKNPGLTTKKKTARSPGKVRSSQQTMRSSSKKATSTSRSRSNKPEPK